ncbi:cytochrome C, partial [Rhizobiaceae sp. 2RAB30]
MPDLLATVWFRITLTLVVSTAAAVTFVATNIARDNHSRLSLAIALTGGDSGNAPPIFRRYGCS